MSETVEIISHIALGVAVVIVAGFVAVLLIGAVRGLLARFRRPVDPDAAHPADEPMWAPWDVVLLDRGICPIHTPAKLGSGDCDRDCPPPREVVAAEMDALDRNVHHNAPLSEPTVAYIEVNHADVWEWMREEWKRDGAAGTTVVIDGAIAPHTVRYVYDDDSAREWDVTARVNAWLLRRAEIAEVGGKAWADPNGELTGPVERAAPYDHLVRLSDNVDRDLGIDRDLPQWADPVTDHGPRTVSHWGQPAKRINGSAL